MRVLVITTNYWPEPTGIAIYTTDLAKILTLAGHQISVLTSLPHYPWWKIPEEFAHLTEGTQLHQGVIVMRVKHTVPSRINALLRMRFEASLWWNLRRASMAQVSNDLDLVIAFIPTVAAGIAGNRIAKQLGIPFGLIVQDLSGAGAKQSGLRGGAIFSKIAHLVEGKVLHGADALVVVSPAMRDSVESLGVPMERITHITNYSARSIVNVEKTSARAKFGWAANEFIVLHTGNMGAKQDLENVVRTADILASNSHIKIYLVGHGNQELNLRNLCFERKNISIFSAVEDENYSALLSAADLLLVNERRTQMEMSLPSKLSSYLYSNRPVLAAVPRFGATWNFLQGIAELVDAGTPELLAKAIVELSKNPQKRLELAKRGLEFARTHLDPEIGRQKYLDWVENLMESKHG
jgi:glycosyltransferase involved in cell wall biosynthesis